MYFVPVQFIVNMLMNVFFHSLFLPSDNFQDLSLNKKS